MTKVFLFGVSLAAVLLVSGSLSAQESGQKKQRIVKVGKTVYDFDEVDIMGRLKKPEGQSVVVAPQRDFRSLLDLDESFIPNIKRSVDEF